MNLMNRTVLSSRQAAFILFMTLVGNALVLAPAIGSGRSSWLSNLLAALIGLYIIAAALAMQRAFPGQSIIKIAELCMGKLAGKLLNSIFLVIICYSTIIYLFNACIIIRIVLPFATCILLRPLVMLAAAYCIYKGVNAVGRLTEILVPIALILITISFALMLIVADFSRLLPVLADWKAILGGAVDGAGWPYSGISILALFLPYVNNLGKNSRIIYVWYLIGVLIVSLRSLLVVAVLGPEVVTLLRFPIYASLRTLALADFQRVELFFFILWFISAFTVLMVSYLASTLALKDFVGLPRLKPLVLPLGFFLTVISLYMYSSDMELYSLSAVTTPLLSLFMTVLYLTVVLLAVIFRRQPGHRTVSVATLSAGSHPEPAKERHPQS